jgi:aspartyl/glutamyl-tRNA(Asn/Gln) amidotransferase C subunit
MPQINNVITLEDVKKVAILSRLSKQIPDDVASKFQKNLNDVLEYANQLSSINTDGYSPHTTISSVSINNLRDDVTDSNTEEYQRIRQNIIGNFPNKQGNFLQLNSRVVEEK